MACLTNGKAPHFHTAQIAYLSDEEVHIFPEEHIQLLLDDGLHLTLAAAVLVDARLGDTGAHQRSALIGHLASYVTGHFVDLLTLRGQSVRREKDVLISL